MTLIPSRRPAGGRRGLKLLLLQLVLVFSVVSSSSEGPAIDESDVEYLKRASCTVDDLLPDYDGDHDLAKNWVHDQLVPPPFDCTCNTLKARWGKGVFVRGTRKGGLNDLLGITKYKAYCRRSKNVTYFVLYAWSSIFTVV